MHAVTVVEGAVRWQEHPDPRPEEGELLVSVMAAGINGADLMQRRGLYPAPPGSPPDIPGIEFAGVVAEVGAGVQRFAVGDRVMTICGGGGQSELATVAESIALPVPESLSWEEAGGFSEVFCTAFDALVTQARLQPGERILISGAAGGVGVAAVQLARAIGAQVVASVRSVDGHDRVSALGADDVIVPHQVPQHGPYDVSLELVGAPGVAAVLPSLATGARIVVIGVGAGAKVELNLLSLMASRATVGGSMLRSRSTDEKAAVARGVEELLLPLLALGAIEVPVAERFPLEQAQQAYERFAAGGKLGKIVLTRQ